MFKFRKESRIIVNGALKQSVKEPPGPARALHLTSDFVIGMWILFNYTFILNL